MMKAAREDRVTLGRAYHSLLMGEDTDEAEAAAIHFGESLELFRRYLGDKP